MKNRLETYRWDAFTTQFFQTGLLLSLIIVYALFNYTVYPEKSLLDLRPIVLEEFETIPIRTIPPEKKQKLKPIKVEEITEIEIEPIDQPEFVDEVSTEVTSETAIINDEMTNPVPEPKKEVVVAPPVIEVEDEVEEVKPYVIVQEMPLFGDCTEVDSKEERTSCSHKQILKYIKDHLNYPPIAKENGIEGKVYIEFVINKDGSLQKANILRDIGGGCGEEALRVINTMPSWTPGRQNGKKVPVLFRIPVVYKLY